MALTAREIEQNERNAWHRQNMEARKRFNESRLAAAHNDPGRFSPWEKRAMEEERKTIALRQHEMDMADKQHASELAIQQEKTRTAGEAARQTGLTNIELSKLQDGYTDKNGVFIPGSRTRLEQERIKAGLTQAENEMETKLRIADIEDKGRDRDSQRRYGYFDPKTGEYVGGSDYNTADVTGEHQATARAQEQAERRGIEQDKAAASAAAKQAETARETARNLEVDRGRALANILEEKDKAMSARKWATLTPEQQRAYLDGVVGLTRPPAAGAAGTGQGAAGTGQGAAKPQGDGRQFGRYRGGAAKPKEGDRQETKQGMAVFRNGQWIIEK